jgi:hypothetical protein
MLGDCESGRYITAFVLIYKWSWMVAPSSDRIGTMAMIAP